mmetsp:Transcript_397/g.729  ORF Transcript_397/g.729 Transcript_397/m.729 type:complete len:211 (+) Transcript_397:495-1127(+)
MGNFSHYSGQLLLQLHVPLCQNTSRQGQYLCHGFLAGVGRNPNSPRLVLQCPGKSHGPTGRPTLVVGSRGHGCRRRAVFLLCHSTLAIARRCDIAVHDTTLCRRVCRVVCRRALAVAGYDGSCGMFVGRHAHCSSIVVVWSRGGERFINQHRRQRVGTSPKHGRCSDCTAWRRTCWHGLHVGPQNWTRRLGKCHGIVLQRLERPRHYDGL